jgi:hypothetical protein
MVLLFPSCPLTAAVPEGVVKVPWSTKSIEVAQPRAPFPEVHRANDVRIAVSTTVYESCWAPLIVMPPVFPTDAAKRTSG